MQINTYPNQQMPTRIQQGESEREQVWRLHRFVSCIRVCTHLHLIALLFLKVALLLDELRPVFGHAAAQIILRVCAVFVCAMFTSNAFKEEAPSQGLWNAQPKAHADQFAYTVHSKHKTCPK